MIIRRQMGAGEDAAAVTAAVVAPALTSSDLVTISVTSGVIVWFITRLLSKLGGTR